MPQLDDPFDASTVTPIIRDPSGVRDGARPAITILWHPDLGRVGARVVVKGGEIAISRNAPTFAVPGAAGAAKPLLDTCMSRERAALTISFASDGVAFVPGGTKAAIVLQGTPLEEARRVDAGELVQGIVVTIGSRVALCLHLTDGAATRRADLGIVGHSDAMESVRRDIERAARSDKPVLIRGESGTGKELVAQAVANQGKRKGHPFVTRNAAGLMATTAYAELFGHERGAFTGAADARAGDFGQADGGTLYLDEIGDIPGDVQAMLLRAVEHGEVVPLGSTRRARRVDVRLITATDADLEADIAAGRFSEPLYQRLSKAEIRLPPLRARREDIGSLLVHFLREAFEDAGGGDVLADRGTDAPWLNADEVARMVMYDWPGNVRELETVAGKLVEASEGQPYASVRKLRELLSHRRPSKPAPREHEAAPVAAGGASPSDFAAIFEANAFKVMATAEALGCSRKHVYKLMERNGIKKVSQISDREIVAAVEASSGDRKVAARRLRVSHYALSARLDALGHPAGRRAAR